MKQALVGFLALHWSFVFRYMKYTLSSKIESITHVEMFVKYLYEDLGLNFHPDDDFKDYINDVTKEKIFNEADANIYNNLVDDCFNVCEKNDVDFYKIALRNNPILQD